MGAELGRGVQVGGCGCANEGARTVSAASAPAPSVPRSVRTTPQWPRHAARCKGARPPCGDIDRQPTTHVLIAFSFVPLSPPLIRRARCVRVACVEKNNVSERTLSLASASAPASSSARSASACPWYAAPWSGVHPFWYPGWVGGWVGGRTRQTDCCGVANWGGASESARVCAHQRIDSQGGSAPQRVAEPSQVQRRSSAAKQRGFWKAGRSEESRCCAGRCTFCTNIGLISGNAAPRLGSWPAQGRPQGAPPAPPRRRASRRRAPAAHPP